MTYQPSPKEFADRLSLILSDQAMTNALKSDCPALAALLSALPANDGDRLPVPVGFPALAELSALQCSIFDNGPKGFGVAFETWVDGDKATVKTRRNDFTLKLHDHKSFKAYLRKTRAKGLSDEWKANMATMLEHGTDYLYGPVYTTRNGVGFQYLEDQFFMVKMDDGEPGEAMIFAHGGIHLIDADCWTQVSHMGKRLHHKCVGSARLDFTGDNSDWATQQCNHT